MTNYHIVLLMKTTKLSQPCVVGVGVVVVVCFCLLFMLLLFIDAVDVVVSLQCIWMLMLITVEI